MSAPGAPPDPTRTTALVAGATALVASLADSFRAHVQRATGLTLDGSVESLAFVDHYLRLLRRAPNTGDTAAPIGELVAAEAGAYYGDLVAREIGGTWIGDGQDPSRLRMLIKPQFLYFAPVAQALEIVRELAGVDATPATSDDAAVDPIDATFHARANQDGTGPDDATWIAQRLAELPPVAGEEYYSLTCRFETLQLVLEMLAHKHADEGRAPREYGVADYVDALVGT
jgi:hypothetical protein